MLIEPEEYFEKEELRLMLLVLQDHKVHFSDMQSAIGQDHYLRCLELIDKIEKYMDEV